MFHQLNSVCTLFTDAFILLDGEVSNAAVGMEEEAENVAPIRSNSGKFFIFF